MSLAYLPGFLELDEDGPPPADRPPAPTAAVDALVAPTANESPSWKALPIWDRGVVDRMGAASAMDMARLRLSGSFLLAAMLKAGGDAFDAPGSRSGAHP